MKKCRFVPFAVMVAVVALFALSACSQGSASGSGSSSASASASQASGASVSEPALEVVGEEQKDAPAFEFANKSGKEITAIAVKATEDAEYPASLLQEGSAIANGDTVILACPAIPEPAQGGSDVQLKRLADISVTLAGDAVCELHQVDLYSIANATLRLEGDVAYLEYTTDSGEAVSTLESEKAIIQQKAEEAAAAEAAAAEAAAAEAAAAEAEAAQPVYVDDSAVGSGDEAQCVPDIVLR